MRSAPLIALIPLLLHVRVPGQGAGTTLAALAAGPGAVVTARCTSTREHAGVRSVDFVRLEQLAGPETAPRFVLREASARHCGEALAAARGGTTYLLFLAADPEPRLRGAGIEPTEPNLIAYVQGLLAAADPGARVRLLAATAAGGAARLAGDAAHALTQEPLLERHADPAVRAQLREALLTRRTLQDQHGLDLFQTLARLQEPAALEVGVDVFVAGRRPGLDRLVRAGIAVFGDDPLARHLAMRTPAGPAAACRQVELLAGLPGAIATEALQQTVTRDAGPARALALRALVTRGDTVPAAVPGAELEAARRAAAAEASRPPRYRNVVPDGARPRG